MSRLQRNTESPVKSPVRTPVTENDPLGAFMNDKTPIVSPCEENDSNCSTSTLTVLNNAIEDRPGGPVLFRRLNLSHVMMFVNIECSKGFNFLQQ